MEGASDALNVLIVEGRHLLLVNTAAAAVHLAAQTTTEGRPAVPAEWLRTARLGYTGTTTSYDSGPLLDPSWSPRALCGTVWQAMAPTDAGPLRHGHEPQYAPTCRRCLGSLDRHFPTPLPDDRIGLVVELITRAVEEHGSAEVLGVPGDQIRPLRAATRRVLQVRFGYNARTWLVEDRLLVSCDEATEHVRLARAHEIIQTMHLGAPAVADDSGWRIRWQTWA